MPVRAEMRKRVGVRLASLLAILLPAPAVASPIFLNTATDAWVVDEAGATVGSYSVGNGQWTTGVSLDGMMTAKILIDGGGSQNVPFASQPAGNVLVNDTRQSYPTLGSGVTSLSLKGLEAAVTDFANTNQPSISVEPADGTYAETIRVRLIAHPGPTNAAQTVIHWSVDGVPQMLAADEAEFFLFEAGSHSVAYHVEQGAENSLPPGTAMFTISNMNGMRDSDGDGLPDAWEVANGLDPLNGDDAGQDSDGDGASDFEEILRGTNPHDANDSPTNAANDPDCDGWPTWDEQIRQTDPFEARIDIDTDGDNANDSCEPAPRWPSKPVARRWTEVEYLLSGSVWADTPQMTLKSGIGRLSVMDLYWEVFFDQAELPTDEELVAENLVMVVDGETVADESQIPSWLRPTAIASVLAGGQLPTQVRVPGGADSIVRARAEDANGLADLWVAKAWLPAATELTPAAYNKYVADQIAMNNDLSWETAAEWQMGYEAYLGANWSQSGEVNLDPSTGLALALLEAAVSWHSDQSIGGEILVGNPDVDSSREALASLGDALALKDRNLISLLEDYAPLVEPGGSLAAFRSTVLGYFSDTTTIPPPEAPDTTESGTAALLQGASTDDDALAAYLAKLYSLTTPEEIAALDEVARTVLLDPQGDSDSDGIANAGEVAVKAIASGDPTAADTDADGFSDAIDPCINDADNLCLALLDLEGDLDGDGVIDAVDNCLNQANADQADSNQDAIGDDCLRYANIRTPVANVRLYPGGSVNFTSIETELGALASGPLVYDWDFGGGAVNSSAVNPGPVSFELPGTWPISLTVQDSTMMDLGNDFRTVTVLGDVPLASIVGAGPVLEGQSLSLSAAASSPNGAITSYAWDFGDMQAASGSLVSHTWLQGGIYSVSLDVQDVIGASVSDSVVVTVADTEPVPSFTLDRQRGPVPHTVRFSDTTPIPYDGLAGVEWMIEGTTPTASVVDHIFAVPITLPVLLTATDGDGSSVSTGQFVQVLTDYNLLSDSDGDGISDAYEVAFGATDPAVDTDADGMSNLVEFKAATNPQDANDVPPGTGGVSTLLFADGFETSVDHRFSLGLSSYLAAPVLSAAGDRVGFGIQTPMPGGLCETATLVSFVAVDGVELNLEAVLDPGIGGRSCLGLARDTDYFARAEACLVESASGFDAELRIIEGDQVNVSSAGSVAAAVDVEIGLVKNGAAFQLTLGGTLVASATSSGTLGDSDLRPYLSLESCSTDSGAASIDIASIMVGASSGAGPVAALPTLTGWAAVALATLLLGVGIAVRRGSWPS